MTKTALVDLSTLDTTAAADKGCEIELLHPVTKAPLGAFISIVGKDSTAFSQHVRRNANERLRKQGANHRRAKADETPTVEKIEDEAISLLAACTTGWRGIVFEGNEMPYSTDNAKKLYSSLKYIREQVDEAIGDIELFLSA